MNERQINEILDKIQKAAVDKDIVKVQSLILELPIDIQKEIVGKFLD